MLRSVRRILLVCFFGLLTGILHLLGRYAPELVFLVYPSVSQNILRVVGGFFSVFPIAMWEILGLLAVIWVLYTFVRDISKMEFMRWITGIALGIAVGVFAVTLLWGLNNYSPPMHEKLQLSGESYSVSRLKQATAYYRDMANSAAKQVPRDENGEMLYGSFGDLAQAAMDGYMLRSVEYDCFRGPRFTPKRMIFGNVLGLDGLFVPFTGECCVSSHTYSACLPFEMCKQIGYGNGFVSEGEASFAAYLGCTASDSSEVRYSGYFSAFSMCYNALYAEDPEAAREIWQGVSQTVQKDCAVRLEQQTNSWRAVMEGLHTELWDAYGKTFRTEESEAPFHDSASDLLTMWYVERIL